MFVKSKNQQIIKFPYTLRDLRRDNPSVSFPNKMTPEVYGEYHVQAVRVEPRPDDEDGKKVEQNRNPEYKVNEWVLGWTVRDYTEQELEGFANTARQRRNQELARTDWTQLADCPLSDEDKAAWSEYRQSLRDITEQENFPLDITWMESPDAEESPEI